MERPTFQSWAEAIGTAIAAAVAIALVAGTVLPILGTGLGIVVLLALFSGGNGGKPRCRRRR